MIEIARYYVLKLFGDKLSDDSLCAMEHDAKMQITAGVRLTREDWKWLSGIERAAWVSASRKLASEDAAKNGLASQGTREALIVGAESDDGEALKQFDRDREKQALRFAAEDLKSRYGGE